MRNCLINIIFLSSFFFNSFTIFDCSYIELNENQQCCNVYKKCLNIWTKIDLMRAVKITSQQKRQFLVNLTDYINVAYTAVGIFLSNKHVVVDEIRQLYSILLSIKDTYQEFFNDSLLLPAYIANLYLLNRMLLKLEDNLKLGLKDPI